MQPCASSAAVQGAHLLLERPPAVHILLPIPPLPPHRRLPPRLPPSRPPPAGALAAAPPPAPATATSRAVQLPSRLLPRPPAQHRRRRRCRRRRRRAARVRGPAAPGCRQRPGAPLLQCRGPGRPPGPASAPLCESCAAALGGALSALLCVLLASRFAMAAAEARKDPACATDTWQAQHRRLQGPDRAGSARSCVN